MESAALRQEWLDFLQQPLGGRMTCLLTAVAQVGLVQATSVGFGLFCGSRRGALGAVGHAFEALKWTRSVRSHGR